MKNVSKVMLVGYFALIASVMVAGQRRGEVGIPESDRKSWYDDMNRGTLTEGGMSGQADDEVISYANGQKVYGAATAEKGGNRAQQGRAYTR